MIGPTMDTELANSYYIVRKSKNEIQQKNEKWLNPRLHFLNSFIKPQPRHCPECHTLLESSVDEDEIYCPGCGLITSASYDYVAGHKIHLPYGKR